MSIFSSTVPGRVNLIGEHTDYNGGMVLPAALSVSLSATLQPRSDTQVVLCAKGFEGEAVRSLSDMASGHWSDPAVGAMREARAMGLLRGGADITIDSTIPAGAGLSSSAALIVAILKCARDSSSNVITDIELALAAQRVEHQFIGVPCGIMDQVAVAVASPGSAIALDTATLDYTPVSLPRDHAMVVIHSGHSRELSDGRYKARKEECDAAGRAFETSQLCQLDPDEIELRKDVPETLRRRARHCATEHRRVLKARDALMRGDSSALGALMNTSHTSMRDDFEMTIPPIDALVDSAREHGAVGARLTGGGFGGCIVCCVPKNSVGLWLSNLSQSHPEAQLVDQV